jgi:sugar lactone lactonase YvrE
MIVSTITTYYFTDTTNGKIHIFNNEWEYIGYKSFPFPSHMITIGNNLHISGLLNLWKTDQDLNELIQYNDSTKSYYWGECNTAADNLIYVASTLKESIDLFDLDLRLVKRILIPYITYSISAFGNQMYVGCEQGVIIL